MSQLRLEGALRLDQMESTGSVSVLSGQEAPDRQVLAGVRGADRLHAEGRPPA